MPPRTLTAGLAGLAFFQAALAAGAPWGAAAWGGSAPGRLPHRLRVASGVAAAVYGGLACAVGRDVGTPRVRRGLVTGLSGLFAVSAVLNAASPSGVERALWTPASAALAALSWLARADVDSR